MQFNYQVSFSGPFMRRMKKIRKYNKPLFDRINQTINQLKINPFYPSLKTHTVNNSIHGEVSSSRVDGDVRILWIFEEGNFKIVNILAVGGHSGSHKIYN